MITSRQRAKIHELSEYVTRNREFGRMSSSRLEPTTTSIEETPATSDTGYNQILCSDLIFRCQFGRRHSPTKKAWYFGKNLCSWRCAHSIDLGKCAETGNFFELKFSNATIYSQYSKHRVCQLRQARFIIF